MTGLMFDSVIHAASESNGVFPREAIIDSQGNRLVVGSLAGVTDFAPGVTFADDQDVVAPHGHSDAFVAKYSSNNDLLWVRRMGSSASSNLETASSLAVTSAGDVFVTGTFYETADFGPHQLTSTGDADGFLAKLSPDGQFTWVLQFDSVGTPALDESRQTLTAWADGSIRQFSFAGTPLWSQPFKSSGVHAYPDGSLLIRGNFTGVLDLDPGLGEYLVGHASLTSASGYAVKLSPSGDFAWGAAFLSDTASASNSEIRQSDAAIAADHSVAITGIYTGAVDVNPDPQVTTYLPAAGSATRFFVKLDSNGMLVASNALLANEGYYSPRIAAGSDRFYLAGITSPTLPFNPSPGISIPATGSNDIFLLELSSTGQYLSSLILSSNGADVAWDLATDPSGVAYLSGSFQGSSIDVNPDPTAAHLLTNSAGTDLFCLRLVPKPPTKFYVVNDASTNRTYEYGETGTAVENYSLTSANSTPRGAASNISGDKVWVVDANKKVYVYDPSGTLLGSWTAGSLPSNANVQGITTNGADIWIVDAQSDKVYRYTNAASRTSGSQNAASSFNLNTSNKDATDLVTDGTSIWVLNNSSTDKVFKYTVGGSLLGSWTINSGGGSPTGITIDPTSVSSIWIVDSVTDRVYQFDNAAGEISGSASPSSSFALASGNTNPQGIADPPVSSVNGQTAPLTSSSADSAFDSVLLAVIGELEGWLTSGKKRK